MENVIETEDIVFSYDGADRPSMNEVSIRIRKGVKTVILGANGAGKSTLFYHFNGVVKPDKGVVRAFGEPVNYRKKGLRQLRSKVAVVLQNPDDQIFNPTVYREIEYGLKKMKIDPEECDRRIKMRQN